MVASLLLAAVPGLTPTPTSTRAETFPYNSYTLWTWTGNEGGAQFKQ